MTTDNPPAARRAGRGRTMQHDLLDDLRQATPVPIVPTAAERAPRPPERPEAEERPAPSLHLHVTLQPWSWPRVGLLPGGSGLSVGIGPVRMSWALGRS